MERDKNKKYKNHTKTPFDNQHSVMCGLPSVKCIPVKNGYGNKKCSIWFLNATWLTRLLIWTKNKAYFLNYLSCKTRCNWYLVEISHISAKFYWKIGNWYHIECLISHFHPFGFGWCFQQMTMLCIFNFLSSTFLTEPQHDSTLMTRLQQNVTHLYSLTDWPSLNAQIHWIVPPE